MIVVHEPTNQVVDDTALPLHIGCIISRMSPNFVCAAHHDLTLFSLLCSLLCSLLLFMVKSILSALELETAAIKFKQSNLKCSSSSFYKRTHLFLPPVTCTLCHSPFYSSDFSSITWSLVDLFMAKSMLLALEIVVHISLHLRRGDSHCQH